MPLAAGDLRRQSFGEVWRDSALFARLREGTLGGKCGRCEFREVCGGCRARAFADSGDVLAADRSCAYEPRGDRELVQSAGVVYGDGPWEAGSSSAPRWAPAARDRFDRVPSFVRSVIAARVERFARERGYDEITESVLEEVRREMPVDFSKTRPFFLDLGSRERGS
jgi:hypothetical protein